MQSSTILTLAMLIAACGPDTRSQGSEPCVTNITGSPAALKDGDPPDAVVSDDELYFDHESVQTRGVTILNIGAGALQINGLQLTESTEGREFSEAGTWVLRQTLCTDAETFLYVTHSPGDDAEDLGLIRIFTNDPKYVDGILEIPLSAD